MLYDSGAALLSAGAEGSIGRIAAAVHGTGTRVKHGRIFGFIDDHLHITGNMRAGGDVISGEPYDRFGIPTALGQDAKIHGVDGKLDLTGNLLRSGVPVGTHDTHGWPTFKGWPTYNSMTQYKRLGVRGMFVAHWVNNAFSGAALEDGVKGVFINILNRVQTGSYFQTSPCPGPGQGVTVTTLSPQLLKALASFFPAAASIANDPMPTYPSGLQCNANGLTSLGRYLIGRMMAEHMLIEVDHLSEPARDAVLAIAAQGHYPLISSHNGTGGEWTPAELRELYKLGGFAAVTPDPPRLWPRRS